MRNCHPSTTRRSRCFLILDEPTVGLDPRVRHELIDLIGGLRARSSMTILLTTHYLDEAELLCDRVAIIHGGEVVALDTPSALLARVGREVVELRVAGNPDAALATLRAHNVADDGAFTVGNSIHMPLHRLPAGEVTAAIAGLGLAATAVITRPPTLDDVYLQLTGQILAPSRPEPRRCRLGPSRICCSARPNSPY